MDESTIQEFPLALPRCSPEDQAPNCPDSELSRTMFESAQSNICPLEATESFYSGEVRRIPVRGCVVGRSYVRFVI
jgi:hypothetical protein